MEQSDFKGLEVMYVGFCNELFIAVSLHGTGLGEFNVLKRTVHVMHQQFNLLATDFFFQILAHPVFKM